MPRVDLQKYNKKVENPFAILWRLVCYFKHCRLLLTAAMLSILAYVAATIGAAYCMKPLTNLLESSGAAPNETYAKYISLILGLAGLYLLSALTNYLLNRLMLECSAIIMKQLRTELFDTMQRQPVRFFDENKTGALMSYYTSDIEATNELLQHSITQLAISITSLVGTVAMMLALSMRLFAIGGAGGHRGAGGAGHHQDQQAHLCQPAASDRRRQRLYGGDDHRPAGCEGVHPRKGGHGAVRRHQPGSV